MRRTLALLIAPLAFGARCSRPEPGAGDGSSTLTCTDIGCLNGLRVHLEGFLGPVERVTASTPGAPRATYIVTCGAAERCDDEVFFPDFTADYVTLLVRTRGGAEFVIPAVRPRYTRDRPNGARCEPECVNGTVTVSVPSDTGQGPARR